MFLKDTYFLFHVTTVQLREFLSQKSFFKLFVTVERRKSQAN